MKWARIHFIIIRLFHDAMAHVPFPRQKSRKAPVHLGGFHSGNTSSPGPYQNPTERGEGSTGKKNKADLRGSVLLFEARWGCLRTHSYKMRFSKEEKCTRDGERRGMMVHVLIECGDIHLGVCYCTSLQQALGIRTTLER